jgi:hypothetical protein
VQVVLDRLVAHEQLVRDLLVRCAVAGHPCDPRLVRRDLVAGVGGSFAGCLAGGQQLSIGAVANALAPISANISWAWRSWSRASRRRRSRRSYSP